ncbi:MAG: DUF1778 domain-containing protein [Thermodesulfobacteriota bacterium]
MMATLPRITARVDADTQNLLNKATALSGMSSINNFVLNAAVEKAKQIIEHDQFLKLTENDANLLIKALDRPAEINPKLKAAAESYERKKQS